MIGIGDCQVPPGLSGTSINLSYDMLAGDSYNRPVMTEKPNHFDWSEQKRDTQRTREGN